MGSRGRPNGGKGAKQTPLGTLSHAVEGDKASVSAGPAGPPEVGKSKGRPGRRRRRQGPRGRGPREKDRPSWGRGSAVGQGSSICWRMGRQRPVSLSARRPAWGDDPQRVNQGRGEWAREDDGDGLCAVPGNPMAGLGSLRRRWRRLHRGIAQENRHVSLGCFEFVHNVRKRGKGVLPALIELLVT